MQLLPTLFWFGSLICKEKRTGTRTHTISQALQEANYLHNFDCVLLDRNNLYIYVVYIHAIFALTVSADGAPLASCGKRRLFTM